MLKKVNIKKLKNISKKVLLSLSTVLVINSFNIKKEDVKALNVDCEYKIFVSSDNTYCTFGNCISDEKLKFFVDKYIEDESLNNSVDTFVISNNNFITDLSILKPIYSKIRRIAISNCSSIIDLTPLYYMNNLEEVYICENVGINKELIAYFDKKNIQHNITNDDLNCVSQINDIYNNIISDNMKNEEKIKAISFYLSTNYEYDNDYLYESNEYPMSCMINNKKGVCASYAYIANILFRMAGIESFELTNDNHVWNVVNINDKYYYVDVTWLDAKNIIEKFEIENFNFGSYYMINPSNCKNTGMTSYNDYNKLLISQDLFNKINISENKKNILERTNMIDIVNNIELFLLIYLITIGFDNAYILRKLLKREKYFIYLDSNLNEENYQKQIKYRYTN